MDSDDDEGAGRAVLAGDVDIGALRTTLGYALRRAQIAVFADFVARCAAEDIRPAQYSVLAVLKLNPGRRQRDISAVLGIQRTNFVPLFDSLERRGLAERRRVPDDRRASALWLTEQGEVLLARVDPIVQAHEARLVARLGGGSAKAHLLTLLLALVEDG